MISQIIHLEDVLLSLPISLQVIFLKKFKEICHHRNEILNGYIKGLSGVASIAVLTIPIK